jgi:glycosyltransferase involved in cell wall biosynthesis
MFPFLMTRKLLVVNLYYAPDLASTGQYAAEICIDLARRGVEVHVVTAEPCYTKDGGSVPRYEVRDGVHVHRIPMGRARGRERMMTRVWVYLRFMWGAWRKAGKLAKQERPDGVLTFHNPPIVGLIGAHIARRHRIPYTYALYDIHPDILIATRWAHLPAPLIWAWRAVNQWIMKGASAIVVLGGGMKRTLVEDHGVAPEKVRIIPIWGRPELEPSAASPSVRREIGAGNGELLLLYSGNMGIMHPIELILDAASLLRDAPLRFVFIGDGAKREPLLRRAEAEHLDRVSFLPFQPEARFIEILAASDACFVALSPGLEKLAVPSRAFTLLSAGRPLITIMAPAADVASLVTETGCGWNVTSGEELAGLIRELLQSPRELVESGRRGRDVYESRFQRRRVIEEYSRLLAG